MLSALTSWSTSVHCRPTIRRLRQSARVCRLPATVYATSGGRDFLDQEKMAQLISAPYGTPLSSEMQPLDARAPPSTPASAASAPVECREAIAEGLAKFKAGDYSGALSTFNAGLEMPGSGVRRDRNKPRERTEGEITSCYFNISCCHAKLGNATEGVAALALCLEAGYADFAVIRSDPDLAAVRADPAFTALMRKYDRPAGGILGSLARAMQGK